MVKMPLVVLLIGIYITSFTAALSKVELKLNFCNGHCTGYEVVGC